MYSGGTPGTGGTGGGGAASDTTTGTAGTVNSGGGGGGTRSGQVGGAGGSGIVIIRYPTYGTLYLGATNTSSADLAEYYVSGDKNIDAGDVVTISDTRVLDASSSAVVNQGVLRKTNKSYDSKLLGIISTNPGVLMGSIDGDTGKEDKRMLALAGRVPIKIASDSAAIAVGDFLTSSDTEPGKAMKATKAGYTVGKALENWNGQDKIDIFVNLGYYMGPLTTDGYFDTGLKIKVTDVQIDTNPIATDSASLSLRDEIASISAQLADLRSQILDASDPAATLSAELWQYATESGKLITIYPVQTADLTVVGKLRVGLLEFDDLASSISSLTGTITIKGDLAITGKNPGPGELHRQSHHPRRSCRTSGIQRSNI